MINKYITVPAIVTEDHKIYPLWSLDVKFIEGDEEYSHCLKIKNNYKEYHNIKDVILNIETKELSLGIDIDIYPDKDRLEYKIGQQVLYESKRRILKHSEIKDIIYEEYESVICKGKNIEDSYYYRYVDINSIKVNDIYNFKVWKPYYVMTDGTVIKWEHQLYKYEI